MSSLRASAYDAIVVGAGPNGLAAAITLASAGLAVLVVEATGEIGGGARTRALTVPGFLHDVCSAIQPLAAGSPFFRALPLEAHGLRWIEPPVSLAHPFDDGAPAVLVRDIDATSRSLHEDARPYHDLVGPLAAHWPELAPDVLAPLHWPAHPLRLARFGLLGLRSADALVRRRFRGPRARALLAGIASHAMVPLTRAGTAALGLVLAVSAHVVGWPIPAGGSGAIAHALASHLRALGGAIVTGVRVTSLDELPRARATLLDLTPRQVLQLGGTRLPARYRRALGRFRYGPGVFKIDWALDGPVPWRGRECLDAGTVHLGGTLEEIVASEHAVWHGEHPERPTVITAQQSRFDPARAPAGHETLWGYCHVPFGSTVDMTARIEAQLERFAPGFRDRVLARHIMTTHDLEAHDANLVGGNISGGANTLDQIFFRPTARLHPSATPVPGLYLCSASTPPGGGVHGLCGYHAARAALQQVFGIGVPVALRR